MIRRALAIGTGWDYKIIFPENATLPAVYEADFAQKQNDLPTIIKIFEIIHPDNEATSDKRLYIKFRICDIPQIPDEFYKFHLIFTLNVDGNISLSAKLMKPELELKVVSIKDYTD